MLRSAWLTWKMHRFEAVTALVLIAVAGISAIVVASHITGLGIGPECWPRNENGDFTTPLCDAAMRTFWEGLGGEIQVIRLALPFAIPAAALLLGVPVVARELETRTASLAWSLSGRRSRWLVSRVVPMLGIVLVAGGITAVLGSGFFDTLRSVDTYPYLHELGSSGAGLLARGVMAFGLALLVGAVVGRTMPALVIAAALVLGWGLVATDAIRGQQTERYLVWQVQDDNDWQTLGPKPLVYGRSGTFDVRRPGDPGTPGGRFDDGALEALVIDACGEAPQDDTGESEALKLWAACADPIYEAEYAFARPWDEIVPGERFGEYVAADVALSLLIGGAAILLTFPIVARRRPGS